MKFILATACAMLSTLSFAATANAMSPDAPKLQRFEFPGLEARVFYNAESQLEKGSPATLAVVHTAEVDPHHHALSCRSRWETSTAAVASILR